MHRFFNGKLLTVEESQLTGKSFQKKEESYNAEKVYLIWTMGRWNSSRLLSHEDILKRHWLQNPNNSPDLSNPILVSEKHSKRLTSLTHNARTSSHILNPCYEECTLCIYCSKNHISKFKKKTSFQILLRPHHSNWQPQTATSNYAYRDDSS